MSAAHFMILCGMLLLAIGIGVIGWYVRQLWIGAQSIGMRLDHAMIESSLINRKVEALEPVMFGLGVRVTALKAWSDSWVALQENIQKQQYDRVGDINVRLIQIETENKTTAPAKREDDDPFSGPRSWAAQAAAAERGEGVRLGA